jgi:hypothetical protein
MRHHSDQQVAILALCGADEDVESLLLALAATGGDGEVRGRKGERGTGRLRRSDSLEFHQLRERGESEESQRRHWSQGLFR